ncbi:gliding motility-associated lipoprotein GldH [Catalinimonas alkaloidigena]|uniref:gliding motility lipoprotein GldH n=1 Tax=Catalinimonas alkaloidigena TaxID=1075417 RepID=UPI002407418A|nr:gliding motility lipoprotein GldH [Catalinimonas alkaloidigena]MDF9797373.1 gliding motility-associated lipoprotein GldH [Catalinimonas alkaloidigena]
MKALKPQVQILPIVILLLFSACDSNRLFEENYNFANKQWNVDTVPSFRFEISNPDEEYNIYWNVRNTISYPYRNLYLTYYLEDTLGRTISTDLHNMLLFDPKTGKPYGSGSGDIFSHQIMAMPEYEFDSAGVYQIRLEQYMRTDTIKDLLSIGVRVEKVE